MNALFALIVVIVIISAVVGAIAQFLNKLNEANAPPPRRPGVGRRNGGAVPRSSDKDMDRFLAEIDRLRRKNSEAGGQQTAQSAQPAAGQPSGGGPSGRTGPTAPPVARPVGPRQSERDRPRGRVVAELAETQTQQAPSRRVDSSGFSSPHVAPATSTPTSPPMPQVEDLPVATVVTPTSSTGAPATRVTRLPQRARPAPKTDLAKNLTGLLNSSQGVAMAIILQEVLGPPKCKKHS